MNRKEFNFTPKRPFSGSFSVFGFHPLKYTRTHGHVQLVNFIQLSFALCEKVSLHVRLRQETFPISIQLYM